MRVYVTKKDIMKGDRGSAVSCPIALSLARRGFRVTVTSTYITIFTRYHENRVEVPKEARAFIKRFDRSGERGRSKLKPFAFSIPIREERKRAGGGEVNLGKSLGTEDTLSLRNRVYAAIADWLLRERGLVAVANTVQELVQAISFSRDGKVAVKVLPREGLGEQWVARAFPTFTGPSSLRYGPQIAGETSWLRRVRDAEEARVAEKGKG